MSVTHLEDFVQMMVKSGSAGASEKAVDGPKWRETLQRLVSRCYAPSSFRSSKDKHRPRRRNSSASHTRSNGRDLSCPRYNKMSFSNAIELANSVVSEYSPVVSLYDVLKFKPNEDSASVNRTQQNEFLKYFGLNNQTVNTSTGKQDHKLYSTHHHRNLINTPLVPFSSDLGIKLIKERPEIPREIHERKIERLERYLHIIPNSNDVQYEVIYNKPVDLVDSHFYTFPTRNFHDKEKLTPKARYLLKKYCKPCSVKLLRLDTKKLNRFAPRQSAEKATENSDNKDPKENIQLLKNKGIYFESWVVLTDNFRKYNLNPSLKTLPVRRTNFLTNKSISKTSDNESRRTRQQNFLKTLTPRDENTMDFKNEGTSNKNVVNAINNLTEVQRTEGSENSNISHNHVAKGRVRRKRINTYYPRRFSPRLQIVNKPLIM